MPTATTSRVRATWCLRCHRAGLREPTDQLDEECRYCGGEVKTAAFTSSTKAKAAIREHYGTARRNMVGTIAALCRTYGFIECAQHQRYFFLPREVLGGGFSLLEEGGRVEFLTSRTDRGPRALRVRTIA